MLLESMGKSLLLYNVSEQGKSSEPIFPTNTSDVVIVDENGSKLTDFLPTIKDSAESATVANPMFGVDYGEVEVSDDLMNVLLETTTTTEETTE